MATPWSDFQYQLWPPSEVVNTNARRYSRAQSGWKGGDHVTPYTYRGHFAVSNGGVSWVWDERKLVIDATNSRSLNEFEISGGIPAWAQPGVNQAYARLRERAIGEQGQLGQFFAEWRDSLGTINRRTVQMLAAAKSLKRGNFLSFLDDLGIDPRRAKPKHRRMPAREIADGASSLWLEYWFGWAPLVDDITSLASIMGQPYPGDRVSASAVSRDTETADNWHCERTIRHKMGATFGIDNPNEFLLNQLGLTDYLGTAWARVPFSFFADWCFDTSTYLQSFNDWAGVRITNGYTNHFLRFNDRIGPSGWEFNSGYGYCKGYGLIRKTSISHPIPNLQVTANLRQSLTRAASAASLLAQTLL